MAGTKALTTFATSPHVSRFVGNATETYLGPACGEAASGSNPVWALARIILYDPQSPATAGFCAWLSQKRPVPQMRSHVSERTRMYGWCTPWCTPPHLSE